MANRRERITGVTAGAERNIGALLRELDDRLRLLERSKGRVGVVESTTSAKAGEFLNIEAPADGLTIVLPEATAALRNARVTLNTRNANAVRVVCILGTVNGESFVVNNQVGLFEAVCNGLDGWTLPGYITPIGSTPTWAETLAAGNTSGANNPTIDAGQQIIFANTGTSPIDGDIYAAGEFMIHSIGDMHMHAFGALHLGHTGDTDLVHIEGDTEIDIASGGSISEQATTTWNVQAGSDATIASTAGNITLNAAGYFQVLTGSTLRLKVTFDGAWELNATPGTAGQYLRTAGASSSPTWSSIAYSELPSIAGLSVLGRSASSPGTPAAITAATARHTLRAEAGLGSIAWGYPIAVRANTGTATDGFQLDFLDGTHTDAVVTPSAGGNAFVQVNIDVASLLAAIDSTSIVVASSTLQRAAITGAVALSQNANTSVFSGIRVNGSATNDRTNLNFLTTSTITANTLDDSGSDEIELFWNVDQTATFTWSGRHNFQQVVTYSSLSGGSALAAGNNNNIAIGAVNNALFTAASGAVLTGMVATVDGQMVWVENDDTTDTFLIAHDSASSTAANRFYLPFGQSLLMFARSGMWFRYNGTLQRWVVAAGRPFTGFNIRDGATFYTAVSALELIEGNGIAITTSGDGSSPLQEIDATFAIDEADSFTWTGTHLHAEKASSPTVGAGNGLFWVDDQAPTQAVFTDDEEADWPIGYAAIDVLTANASATNATTVLTAVSDVVPADTCRVGTCYRFTAYFVFVHTAAATPLIRATINCGGVSRTVDMTPAAVASTYSGKVEALITYRTVGASGTAMLHVRFESNAGTAVNWALNGNTETSTQAIDTTANHTNSLTLNMVTAVASNTLTVVQGVLERLR